MIKNLLVIFLFIISSNLHASNCSTSAGNMPQDTIFACLGDIVSSQIDTAWTNDGNDTLVYYLHTGNSISIINPIDSNYTGVFNDNNIIYNTLYYISAVAADKDTLNWINLKDTCLNVSIGTPVIWLKPFAEVSDRNSSCGHEFILNGIQSLSNAEITWFSNDTLNITFNSTKDSAKSNNLIDTVYSSILDSSIFLYLTEVNQYCTTTDSVEIYFAEEIYIDFDITPATCKTNNGKIIAHPMKGKSPYYNYDTLYWKPDPQISNWLDTIQTNMYTGKYKIQITNEYCNILETAIVKDSGLVKADFSPIDASGKAEELTVNFSNSSYTFDEDENTPNNNHPKEVYWIIQKRMFINELTGDSTFLDTIIHATYDETDMYNLSYTYKYEGSYIATLIAISDEGCKDTSYSNRIIVTAEPLVKVPTVFTPNGDNINDTLTLKTQSLKSLEILIFNRWGHKIYEWNNETPDNIKWEGWDGKDKNTNKIVPAGVYFYIIKAVGNNLEETILFDENEEASKEIKDRKKAYKGFITVIHNK